MIVNGRSSGPAKPRAAASRHCGSDQEHSPMQTSSRSVPGAADAGLASPELVEATSSSALADAASVTGRPTTELIRRSMEANAALMRGEIDRYRALITLADD